ncbi:hypothetical protein L0128_23290 [candidate division KSB1 bacterium]|nr:hypothetical protein [candidate division KSB1 bacterium]
MYMYPRYSGRRIHHLCPTIKSITLRGLCCIRGAATGEQDQGSIDGYWTHTVDYLAHVRTDDTATGYFQYVLLHSMGGQFYLQWHRKYDDTIVICNPKALAAVFAATDSFLQSGRVPGEVRQKVESIDFSPLIKLTKDMARVRVVTFTKWGGFAERKFIIGRKFPHQVINLKTETLVEYDCDILF